MLLPVARGGLFLKGRAVYGQDNDQDDQDVQRALAQYQAAQQSRGMTPAQQGMQVAPQSPMMRPSQQPMPAQQMGAQSPYAQSQAGNLAAMRAAQGIASGAPAMPMGGPAAAAAMGAASARPPMPPQAQGVPQRPPMPPQAQGAPGGANPVAAAAAAKGLGAAGAGVPVAAVVAQYLDKQRQNALMRQQAQQNILARQAAENGAPTAGIYAARVNQAADRNEGADYLSPLLKYFGR